MLRERQEKHTRKKLALEARKLDKRQDSIAAKRALLEATADIESAQAAVAHAKIMAVNAVAWLKQTKAILDTFTTADQPVRTAQTPNQHNPTEGDL